MKRIAIISCLAVTMLVAILTVAHADDRDLLRTTSAPPNVLLILDSGASMTHDPNSNFLNYLAAGDDQGLYTDFMIDHYGTTTLESQLGPGYVQELNRGSKLPQAKRALTALLDSSFQFNWGFSYYQKTAISVGYLNFIYRVKEYIDSDGDGVEDNLQPAMLNGSTSGTPMRFGSSDQYRGNTSPAPIFTVRYGVDGDEVVLESTDPLGGNSGTAASPVAGDVRLVSFLVNGNDPTDAGYDALYNLTLAERKTGHDFYYPAYDYDSLSATSWVDAGLDGSKTWAEVATHNSLDITDSDPAVPSWKESVHDLAVTEIEATQIGSETLYIAEVYQVYSAAGTWVRATAVNCPTCPVTAQITEVEFVQHFVLYDKLWSDDPPTGDTLSSVDYQGTADCAGYLDEGQGLPIVAIDEPDALNGGATVDQSGLIKTYLGPQTTPIFYFPGETTQFLPAVRDDYIPLTETVTAIGRRPIKDSLNEAEFYFKNDIAGFNDPLSQCRMNFVIIVTDGIETCSNTNAPCSAATNLFKNTEGAFGAGSPGVSAYVVYFGSEFNALNPDLSVVECVADNSNGKYFAAGNEEELVAAFMAIGRDIEERTRGFSSPIVPSVETSTKQMAYISTFTPFDGRSIWRGHLRSYPIDPQTGVIADLNPDGSLDSATALWDAGDVLASRWDWGDILAANPQGSGGDPRTIYYGLDVSGTPTRRHFAFAGDDESEFLLRAELGSLMFGSWASVYADELPEERVDLRNVVDFERGVRYGTDVNGNRLGLRHIRHRVNDQGDLVPIPTSSYLWCGAVGNVGTGSGDNAGCGAGDTVLGVEKLGDIFHSVPQRMASPSCFACWNSDYQNYRGFLDKHRHRRTVLFAGANDGFMHAFDAGLWDIDGLDDYPPQFDAGTGRELFAWAPTSVMDNFPTMATTPEQQWSVDGTPTIADVFIDPTPSTTPTVADREWRSLLLWGQRRGGRSIVALDITQPDTYTYDNVDGTYETDNGGTLGFETRNRTDVDGNVISSWDALSGSGLLPNSGRDPLCADGTAAGCSGAWPALRWEFTDTSNEDSADPNTEPDLGQTWSRPLVGFVKTSTGDRMAAFFGGGYSPLGLNAPAASVTGNWIYGIDVETGLILFKEQVEGMVPGHVQGLDLDLNGFLEKLYFGTTAGNIYRVNVGVTGAIDNATKRVTNWTPEKIFDAVGYQPFFMRPSLAPISFNADGSAQLVIVIGAGNRDGIFEKNAAGHRFYSFREPTGSPVVPVTDVDLTGFTINSGVVLNTVNALTDPNVKGWYYELTDTDRTENWEKVNTPALILNDYVIFSTFNPVTGIQVVPVYDDAGDEVGTTCRESGGARTYVLSLYNANPKEGEDGTYDGRYSDHDAGTAMVTGTVVYVGADGKIHATQATDDLKLEEPIASFAVPVRMVNWKEN